MKRKDLPKNLPDTPGVYFFKKRGGRMPLYIGKATSLKSRVRSYFNPDIPTTRGGRIVKMLEEATTVSFAKTDSVLEALLLETELIKKFKPTYNEREKDDKSYNYIAITKEEFPMVVIIRGQQLSQKDEGDFRSIFGPFPHNRELKEAARILRKLFPWRDTKCIPNQGKPCFNRQINLCPGVCTGEISAKDYRFIIKNLELFLSGEKKKVVRAYEEEMKKLAAVRKFEEALQLRNKVFALKHIHDVALLGKEEIARPQAGARHETNDKAQNIGGSVVGVMTVWQNNSLSKNDYRKFRIRSVKGTDDTGNLKEMLARRFNHPEWPHPEAIVVDGSTAQIRAAENVLSHLRLAIPVIAVTKDEHHRPRAIKGPRVLISKWKAEILLLNGEAHRFAIAYHKNLRAKNFLPK
jgi:excinuclease UvrABC nuclease subunit